MADAAAVVIKFRDFLVTFSPWLIMALIAAAGTQDMLHGQLALKRQTGLGLMVGAGFVFGLPSLFGTLGLGVWLTLLRSGFMIAALVVAAILVTGPQRARVVEGWLGGGLLRNGPYGWMGQARRLWGLVWKRFDEVAPWFIGGCAVSGLMAVLVPYQLGVDLFGRAPWLGALLGALVGTFIRRGTGAELPLAGLLMLKGGGAGAVVALMLASTPLPVKLWHADSHGWQAGLLLVVCSAVVGNLVGPMVL